MSDEPPKVPPTPSGKQLGAQIPAVDLANVNVSVGAHPLDPKMKAMIIGPVMLVLPFTHDAARQVASGLSGIQIVPVEAMPRANGEILQ